MENVLFGIVEKKYTACKWSDDVLIPTGKTLGCVPVKSWSQEGTTMVLVHSNTKLSWCLEESTFTKFHALTLFEIVGLWPPCPQNEGEWGAIFGFSAKDDFPNRTRYCYFLRQIKVVSLQQIRWEKPWYWMILKTQTCQTGSRSGGRAGGWSVGRSVLHVLPPRTT